MSLYVLLLMLGSMCTAIPIPRDMYGLAPPPPPPSYDAAPPVPAPAYGPPPPAVVSNSLADYGPPPPAPGPYVEPQYEKGMPYAYAWEVSDRYSGNEFGQVEESDGDIVQGSYNVVLPDGRKQTVTYEANHEGGYVANVAYEGEAQYPPAPAPYGPPPYPAPYPVPYGPPPTAAPATEAPPPPPPEPPMTYDVAPPEVRSLYEPDSDASINAKHYANYDRPRR